MCVIHTPTHTQKDRGIHWKIIHDLYIVKKKKDKVRERELTAKPSRLLRSLVDLQVIHF